MAPPDSGSWTEDLSGRERVRRVVELLDGPATVGDIADRAGVSRTTADDELGRLAGDDWVTETTLDGTRAYDLNPVRLLFDEITDLIADHSRDELEGQLTELQAEREELTDEYGVGSLSEFRDGFVDGDLSADELRERRNVVATWEALDTEISLVRHALQLYDDVVELGSPGSDPPSNLV